MFPPSHRGWEDAAVEHFTGSDRSINTARISPSPREPLNVRSPFSVVYTRANHLGVTRCDRNESGEPGPWSVPPKIYFLFPCDARLPAGAYFLSTRRRRNYKDNPPLPARETLERTRLATWEVSKYLGDRAARRARRGPHPSTAFTAMSYFPLCVSSHLGKKRGGNVTRMQSVYLLSPMTGY